MKTFGWKALFRTLVIFASIYLVRYGIEAVRDAEGMFLKIGLVIGFFAAILLIMILPDLFSPTRRTRPGKDRDPNNENADG